MSVELKIKAKHLALEPAIIRNEERKLLDQIAHIKRVYQVTTLNDFDKTQKVHQKWYSLQHHRKTVVRNESRATHLARAYISGMPYKVVEKKRENDYLFYNAIMDRIVDMVAKYGDKPLVKRWNKEHNKLMYNTDEYLALAAKIQKWVDAE